MDLNVGKQQQQLKIDRIRCLVEGVGVRCVPQYYYRDELLRRITWLCVVSVILYSDKIRQYTY